MTDLTSFPVRCVETCATCGDTRLVNCTTGPHNNGRYCGDGATHPCPTCAEPTREHP